MVLIQHECPVIKITTNILTCVMYVLYLLVLRTVSIRVVLERVVSVHYCFPPFAAHGEGVSHHAPLGFVIECHYLESYCEKSRNPLSTFLNQKVVNNTNKGSYSNQCVASSVCTMRGIGPFIALNFSLSTLLSTNKNINAKKEIKHKNVLDYVLIY